MCVECLSLVNMFYMKTCSFRMAQPRLPNEGLICIREPEALYELTDCGNCALCFPNYSRRYRSKKTVVDFNRAHRHRFVNGYEAILNCPAVCLLVLLVQMISIGFVVDFSRVLRRI
jgi:hypothetical protein